MRCDAALEAAHDLRGGLLARELAEVLLDVLDLERALLEVVLRDVIFHGSPAFYMISRRQFLTVAALAARPRPAGRGWRPAGGSTCRQTARLRVRVRPPALRVRGLGLQPEGRRQRPRLGRPVHVHPGATRRRSSSPRHPTSCCRFPFVFMTGHKLVRFSSRASARTSGASPTPADCCSPTTATTTSMACTRRSFEQEMQLAVSRRRRSPKLPATHPLYRSFFTFNGRTAADLARAQRLGRQHRPRLPARRSSGAAVSRVLYSNKDYGCEWDYDWRNKRFLREDNTKFAVNIVAC